MPLKLSLDTPSYEKGKELYIMGVAVLNGGSVELTEEQEQRMLAHYGKLPSSDDSSDTFKVAGSPRTSAKTIKEALPVGVSDHVEAPVEDKDGE